MPNPTTSPNQVPATPILPRFSKPITASQSQKTSPQEPPPLPPKLPVVSGISATAGLAAPQDRIGVHLNPKSAVNTQQLPYWNYQSTNIVRVAGKNLKFTPSKTSTNLDGPTFPGKITFGIFKVGTDAMTYTNAKEQKLSVDLGSRGRAEIQINGSKAFVTGNANGIRLPQNGVQAKIQGNGSAEQPFTVSFNDLENTKHEISWHSPSQQK